MRLKDMDNSSERHKAFMDYVMYGRCVVHIRNDGKIKAMSPFLDVKKEK